MEKVSITHYYSSYNYDNTTMIKNYYGTEEEVKAVLDFEDKLRTILDKYRTKEELLKEITVCSEELNTFAILFPKARKKHFQKALVKAENDYSFVVALSDIVSKQKFIDFKYLLYFIIKYPNCTIIIFP